MALDIDKAITDYIYSLLTEDTYLQTAMGGTVRMAYNMATPDTEFPYLVHRLALSADDFYPASQAVYYLDIWSDSPNGDEALAIRKLIMNIIDEIEFNTALDEATRVRVVWQGDTFVVEAEQYIWHRAMMFNLYYFRNAEITVIDAR